MKLFTIKVTNTSDMLVGRGGYIFPAKSTKEVAVSDYGFAEIGAHQSLKVIKNETPKPVEVEPVEEVVQEEPEVIEEEPEEEEVQEDEFPCPHCDFVGKSKTGLRKHIKRQHSGE